jgi:hypothetical protein
MNAPCMNCSDSEIGCHSHCDRYSEYRTVCDKIKAAREAEKAADDAFRDRGDKIRRDVRKYGVYKTGKS